MQAGFLETLLDRDSATSYEAKRRRYAVARRLADTPPEVVTERQHFELVSYVHAGVLAASHPTAQFELASASS